MSNDPPKPMSDEDVVALAKEAIEASREDLKRRSVADTPGSGKDLQQQPGITIDLGHKNIVRLPEEVIDVIRVEIERLALSHNNLSNLPQRLPECHRLRYLNVRYNSMREIPPPILQMTSLEILDVSKNKIRVIPDEIANLTSLKVLAIQKNKIEKLPICLGDISSLQVLKLDGNPISFPPPDVCTIKDNTPSPSNENEKDAVIATQVKKYMRSFLTREKLRIESEEDESVNKMGFSCANSCYSESNVATPRPSKRVSSGRFPVKPSISNLDVFGDARPDSPGIPPPIPTRSHYRVQSQQNSNATRRPVISPLMIGSSNERNRSQSEGAGSATIRVKRMGIYTHKTPDLGAVDELRRNSHFRGFSQGYPTPGGSFANGISGPATAAVVGENGTQRTLANRPLSDLLEHKRRSRAPDVVVEAAKSFLYAMSQLHDTVLNMMRAIKRDRIKEGFRKKEDFPRRFTIAYLQIRNLGELLRKFDTLAEEDEEEAQKLSGLIHQACLRSLSNFMLVNLSIAENARDIARDGDPRFIRSFLLLQQGSLIELRNACSVLGMDFKDATKPIRKVQDHGRSVSTTQMSRPLVVRRFQAAPQQRLAPPYQMPPPVSLNSNESSRTNTLTSISAATPRSGESFATLATSAVSRTNTMQSTFDDPDEEAQFERIYIKLRTACEYSMENIPHIQRHLRKTYELEKREFDSEDPKMKVLGNLIEKSDFVYSMAWALTKRLSQIKLKDPVARSQHDFWQQCTTYIKAWGDLATATTGEARRMGLLNEDLKLLMKPLHRAVKDASLVINASSWSHLALAANTPASGVPTITTSSNHTSTTSGTMGPPSALPSLTSKIQPPKFFTKPLAASISAPGPAFPGPINTALTPSISSFTPQQYSAQGYVTPVPATPLSAALGAAAQATVPNTPNQVAGSGGQHTGPFAGNVFERADRLLQAHQRRI
ncbi:hypothetical protein AOQ84DRAFT_283395 [Glonium stellatum]|uniref:Disease resistance R13L4/SHOC-2-like LRR domain-containing protein n=1 Tax=Glonium stellatum TaxID=574774 RepID=A0A8E2FA00_9PEZI|nr:hypothetical protein AOQ84DRAFT_283395 [Glonium stellatum]